MVRWYLSYEGGVDIRGNDCFWNKNRSRNVELRYDARFDFGIFRSGGRDMFLRGVFPASVALPAVPKREGEIFGSVGGIRAYVDMTRFFDIIFGIFRVFVNWAVIVIVGVIFTVVF